MFPRRISRILQRTILAVILMQGIALSAHAEEAWLVTYGPGHDVWERFGHNAIWLRDAESGLDHVYSFGYFEMDRPGFLGDFVRGIMRYFGSAAPSEDEFAFYRGRDRSIRVQRLDLDAGQFRELHELLHENIFPIPQYYDYDYFFANCSTWLRDLIDEVVDGRLREQIESRPARLNFRDHIRRYNQSRLELHAGLLTMLGPMIDRPRNAWEESFIPAGLSNWVGEVSVDGRPLVAESRTLFESSEHSAPATPSSQWWAYALASLLAAAVVSIPMRRGRGFWSLLPWRVSVAAVGLAGVLVLAMWLGTGHDAIDGNRIVLLLNPFWLLLLAPLPRPVAAALWWLVAAAAAAGAVLLCWPGGPQYRPEIVCGLLPLLAVMLWIARGLIDPTIGVRGRDAEGDAVRG